MGILEDTLFLIQNTTRHILQFPQFWSHFISSHHTTVFSCSLSQEVIWKQLHLKSKILYLKYRNPLSKVWKVFLFEHSFSNDHCPSVAKLLSLLGSYCLFLITENNRSLVLISLEDYISVSDFTNKPSPSQGLQIYIVTREGNFPGNNRIK